MNNLLIFQRFVTVQNWIIIIFQTRKVLFSFSRKTFLETEFEFDLRILFPKLEL